MVLCLSSNPYANERRQCWVFYFTFHPEWNWSVTLDTLTRTTPVPAPIFRVTRPLDISSHELSLICSRDLPILRTRSWTPWVWCGGATSTQWAGSISIITGRGHRSAAHTTRVSIILYSHHEIFVILDVLQKAAYYYFIFTSFCGGRWTGLSTPNSILFVIYGTLKIAAGDKAPE